MDFLKTGKYERCLGVGVTKGGGQQGGYCNSLRTDDWVSLVAQMVNNLPAMRETWVRSLNWEDPLEEDMATHSSILAWRIPMDHGAWRATVHGSQRVGHD